MSYFVYLGHNSLAWAASRMGGEISHRLKHDGPANIEGDLIVGLGRPVFSDVRPNHLNCLHDNRMKLLLIAG